jgi:hypothetical protein
MSIRCKKYGGRASCECFNAQWVSALMVDSCVLSASKTSECVGMGCSAAKRRRDGLIMEKDKSKKEGTRNCFFKNKYITKNRIEYSGKFANKNKDKIKILNISKYTKVKLFDFNIKYFRLAYIIRCPYPNIFQ